MATIEAGREAEFPPGAKSRVKTPTVLQMQVTECGAASLGMVLAHYGRWVPLEELRERCGASRDGRLHRISITTAGQFGLTTKGYYRRRGPPARSRISADPAVEGQPLSSSSRAWTTTTRG